ncbi:MAG: erythromycin esterase family protein [Acidimicrobiia bacterium]
MRSAVVLVILGLVGMQGCSPPEVSESTFVDWAAEAAIVLDPIAWNETAARDLSDLDQLVDGARVVFLGEPDHYVIEKYDYRLVMIRYLVERGYRYIGMEMGLSDGTRVDDYLETGDSSHLDRIALYGYRGDMRDDRDDTPGPLVAWSDPAFHQAFVDEEIRFLTELYSISTALPDRLRWFGFDVDPFPGGGYSDWEAVVGSYADEPLVRNLSEQLARVPGESRAEEVDRLEQVEVQLEGHSTELDRLLGPESFSAARQILRNLIESLHFRDLAFREPFGQYWDEGLDYREAAISARLDTGWLEQLPGDSKVILMGHNFHLSKEGVGLRSGGSDGEGKAVERPSFGSAVALREEVCSIWMLYDHGTTLSALEADPLVRVDRQPDRIESVLTRVGSVFVLAINDDDDRAAWLDQDLNFVQNGGLGSGNLRRQADVLFFVDEVHAVGAATTVLPQG